MITHKLIEGETKYPIGNHIVYNLPVINSMANGILGIKNIYFADKDGLILICRGSSGSIIAGIVANKLFFEIDNITIIHIKKEDEVAHNDGDLHYGIIKNQLIVVIDDFISTGNTIWKIIEKTNIFILPNKYDILCVSGNGATSSLEDYFEHQIISK
ncbi:MAG: phosphoribosyltransferase [Candidatus Omnitrophica bacterium]|jgi:hypothetical protein|nr:phosphoribosyltransferase [Candidatus Omnitrophota bacterium]